MERNVNNRFQLGLIVFLLLLAIGMGLIIVMLLRDRGATQQRPQAALGEQSSSAAPSALAPSTRSSASTLAATPTLPAPTFVPVNPGQVTAPSPPAVVTEATNPPTPAPAPPTAAPVPVRATGTTVRLDDDAWQGSYRTARGYGGRSATWIYGANTEYSTMQAAFVLDAPPMSAATLTIEGMDSEDRAKTPIRITVNDVEIFNGPNPLPNDDLPLESGTWTSATFQFDPGLLQTGQNTIQITNLKPGAFSLPPFFMLDYAIVTIE